MILTQNIIANVVIWIVQIVSVVGLLPQIFFNYKVKSTKGLSNAYILIYLYGCIVNLFYVFCLNLPLAYKVIAPLPPLLVLVLAFQCVFYNKRKVKSRSIKLYCVNFFIIFLLFSSISLAVDFPYKIGHLAGWASVAIWTIYQLPQVFKIHSKKSAKGFSFALVSITGFQNLLELMAALALGVPLQTVFIALRGIVLFAIFCFQFWIYRKKSNQVLVYEKNSKLIA